jgi:hypothetical protein
MMGRLTLRRRLAGRFALSLAVLLAGWSLAEAQDAASSTPSAEQQPAPADNAAPSPWPVYPHWQEDLAAWRAAREKEIGGPDGWLTLVGMEWLQPGVNSIGGAADNKIRVHAKVPDHIGLLIVLGKKPEGTPPGDQAHEEGQTVQFLAPTGGFPPDLMIDGKPAWEGQLTVDGPSPSTISWHSVTMVALRRGNRFALRIKDADSPARAGYKGLNWFAPNPRYRLRAAWTPYTPNRTVKIPTALGTTIDLPSPGFAEFELDGKPVNLEPVLEDPDRKTLFFILKDVTNEIETYGTARFLYTGLPDHGLDKPGTLILDFNLLENPPCAYTSFAACPQPPDQNQLPVAIEAGERLYAPQ